jgi:hypothetical protein
VEVGHEMPFHWQNVVEIYECAEIQKNCHIEKQANRNCVEHTPSRKALIEYKRGVTSLSGTLDIFFASYSSIYSHVLGFYVFGTGFQISD